MWQNVLVCAVTLELCSRRSPTAATYYCWPISSHLVKWVRWWQACLSGYSQKAFFTNLTWTLGQPKSTHAPVHTFAHTRVTTWVPKWPRMLGNQVTPPPLLWAPLLLISSPLLFPPYFFFSHSVYSTNCFLSALKPDLSSAGCCRGFTRSPDVLFLQNLTTHLGAEITSRDRRLWLVNVGRWCFLPYVYHAGRDC